jgi:hypothetical protein
LGIKIDAIIKSLDAARKAEADKAAAKAVMDKINAIGNVTLSEDSKNKIASARNAYNALTEDQKKLVTNLATIANAQAKYDKLYADDQALKKKQREDLEAANAVIHLLYKLAESDIQYNEESKKNIENAIKEFSKLTQDQ